MRAGSRADFTGATEITAKRNADSFASVRHHRENPDFISGANAVAPFAHRRRCWPQRLVAPEHDPQRRFEAFALEHKISSAARGLKPSQVVLRIDGKVEILSQDKFLLISGSKTLT